MVSIFIGSSMIWIEKSIPDFSFTFVQLNASTCVVINFTRQRSKNSLSHCRLVRTQRKISLSKVGTVQYVCTYVYERRVVRGGFTPTAVFIFLYVDIGLIRLENYPEIHITIFIT